MPLGQTVAVAAGYLVKEDNGSEQQYEDGTCLVETSRTPGHCIAQLVAKAACADGILQPSDVAEAVVRGLEAENFLILPHPQVTEYFRHKAGDYDRWLGGMRKFPRSLFSDDVMSFHS